MLTEDQACDLMMERNPDVRNAVIDGLSEAEAKDFIKRFLRVMHREVNTGFPKK